MKNGKVWAVPLLSIMTAGCATWKLASEIPLPQEQGYTLQQELEDQKQDKPIPSDILDYLQPLSSSFKASDYGVERFQVSAKDVPAQEFFGSLIAESPYNLAMHPSVKGSITLNLKNVMLAEVLQTVSDLYGYDIREKNKVIHIYPADLTTEHFSLNYLTFTRDGRSRTTVSAGRLTASDDSSSSDSDSDSDTSTNDADSNANSTLIETNHRSDFWTEINDALRILVPDGNGRAITMSPHSGLITVRAYPGELRSVRQFLAHTERQMHRQVALEARILEVTLDKQFDQGIEWKKVASGNGLSIVSAEGLPVLSTAVASVTGGGVELTGTRNSFTAIIRLLSTQGEVNTLSSPRVTTLNNQKAVIKVGTDEYFVTDVSTTTVTGTSTTTTPEVELTPFFSGIALDVTPQIDHTNQVLLHVHPSVIDIEEQVKKIDLGTLGGSTSSVLELPLARSSIRESDTIVRVRSGDIVVIGGLMKHKQSASQTQIPWLGDIPGVGRIFRNNQELSSKIELVILLRPVVIHHSGDWQDVIQDSLSRIRSWENLVR